MKRRSAFRNALEYGIARGVLWTLAVLPERGARSLARVYAHLLDRGTPRLRRIARQNLSFALPETDPESVIDGVFASIGRLLYTFARLPTIDRTNVDTWIRCEGYEHVEAALARGKGVLFATAHLGNWELSAVAFALMTKPMSVVARPLDNPGIDRLVARYRKVTGNSVIDKKDAARAILRVLASNGTVGVLIDQNSSLQEGVFVEFFGLPACAGTGFAKLAAHSGAAVIPGFALWEAAEGRYVLRFYPPVNITGDAANDTQRLHALLEKVIRQYPDQWLWIHRRWKTRPPGDPLIY